MSQLKPYIDKISATDNGIFNVLCDDYLYYFLQKKLCLDSTNFEILKQLSEIRLKFFKGNSDRELHHIFYWTIRFEKQIKNILIAFNEFTRIFCEDKKNIYINNLVSNSTSIYLGELQESINHNFERIVEFQKLKIDYLTERYFAEYTQYLLSMKPLLVMAEDMKLEIKLKN